MFLLKDIGTKSNFIFIKRQILLYVIKYFDAELLKSEFLDEKLDEMIDNLIAALKTGQFKENCIKKSVYFNENSSSNSSFCEADYCLFAIFCVQFGEVNITMYNYLNKDNDESKKYVTFGRKELIFSEDQVHKDLKKPAVKHAIYLSTCLFNEMMNKIKKNKETSESVTSLQKIYKVKKIEDDNNISTQDMSLRDLLVSLSLVLFDASDMTAFPMFPIDINNIINYDAFFALKLMKPAYVSPSLKKNLKPFAIYLEKKVERKENRSRFFMPQLIEHTPKEKTVISSITSYFKEESGVDYRLCNVNNRHITECYPAKEEKVIINFQLGTLVYFIVYSPFKVDPEKSKIMWVNFRKDNSFVGYPELIKADKDTFGETEIKQEERDWLSEKDLLDVNHINRKFGVITNSGITIINKNPFFISSLKDHPDFVVIYQEISKETP